MSAYMIFTREKTLDKAEMATYSQQAFATMQGHPGKLLAAYGPHEVLEGTATEGALILEFPTVEAAKAWYDSPAYRQVGTSSERRTIPRHPGPRRIARPKRRTVSRYR
jgi:uncharacterized protein (DUF1330 family)